MQRAVDPQSNFYAAHPRPRKPAGSSKWAIILRIYPFFIKEDCPPAVFSFASFSHASADYHRIDDPRAREERGRRRTGREDNHVPRDNKSQPHQDRALGRNHRFLVADITPCLLCERRMDWVPTARASTNEKWSDNLTFLTSTNGWTVEKSGRATLYHAFGGEARPTRNRSRIPQNSWANDGSMGLFLSRQNGSQTVGSRDKDVTANPELTLWPAGHTAELFQQTDNDSYLHPLTLCVLGGTRHDSL